MLFDIDGVIMRGKKLIPAAKHAMECLTDDNGKFVVPTVFVTNAGNSLCETKAEKLSSILDMEVKIYYLFFFLIEKFLVKNIKYLLNAFF